MPLRARDRCLGLLAVDQQRAVARQVLALRKVVCLTTGRLLELPDPERLAVRRGAVGQYQVEIGPRGHRKIVTQRELALPSGVLGQLVSTSCLLAGGAG